MDPALLYRGVGGGTPPGADHLRHRRVSHLLTKDKNHGGGDCKRDRRAHGSPDPHELDAPIGGVISVGGQRLGHTLADQHEAGRIDPDFDQVFAD
jgi:hypothetical protein